MGVNTEIIVNNSNFFHYFKNLFWIKYCDIIKTLVLKLCLTISFLFSDENQAQVPKKKVTTPYMTKYERARVLGTRALQIR